MLGFVSIELDLTIDTGKGTCVFDDSCLIEQHWSFKQHIMQLSSYEWGFLVSLASGVKPLTGFRPECGL